MAAAHEVDGRGAPARTLEARLPETGATADGPCVLEPAAHPSLPGTPSHVAAGRAPAGYPDVVRRLAGIA